MTSYETIYNRALNKLEDPQLAQLPEEDLEEIARQDPDFKKDWDPVYGDRMQKIVFIGQKIDKEQLTRDLDFCLVSE